MERWSAERAQKWSEEMRWLVGVNFIPIYAVNQLEMWQAATFDEERIRLELGWAAGCGMNCIRVFLQDQLWVQDAAGFLDRVDRLLGIAAAVGIRVLLVLFDSCWSPEPRLGVQPAPVPGVHNSGWVQSPGWERLMDVSCEGELREYVLGVVGCFAGDERVLGWDVWNEPDNQGGDPPERYGLKLERVLVLLPKVFGWVREAGATQPCSSGVWVGDWGKGATEMVRLQLAASDVISFHNYGPAEEFEGRIRQLVGFGRPMLCTEYLARGVGSTFEACLPVGKQFGVGMLNWGFVRGKTQTYLPWDSWQKPYREEPVMWFHDVLWEDGRAYREGEVELMRGLSGTG